MLGAFLNRLCLRRVAMALGLLALPGGCGVADRFAGRSVSYDIQSESVRNQAILLNIVRAALRKPMMFVDAGAVSGTSTVSGTGTLAAPLWIMNSLAGGGTGSLSPAVTVSGGPTFALTPLVTKEFYQGILAPVPTQMLADLIAYGIPKRVVMLLAIQRIVIAAEIDNHYRTYPYFNDLYGTHAEDFSEELDRLLKDGGLTVEPTSSTATLTPPLPGSALLKPEILASVLKSDIAVHDLTLEKQAAAGKADEADLSKAAPGDMFLLTKSSSGSAFCFHPDDPVSARDKFVPVPAELTDAMTGKIEPLRLSDAYCDTIASFKPHKPDKHGKPDKPDSSAFTQMRSENTASHASRNGRVSMYIVVRSVQQILYALGEIARAELGLDPDLHLPAGRDDPFHPTLADLVRLNTLPSATLPGADDIDTLYDGKRYWVDTDPRGRNRSTQVIDLVGQMLALNNSAKDLPAPSTLTLISH
jgi:hypothetical protein